MNETVLTNDLVALLAMAVGLLVCFWGYRILKLLLALTGGIGGAMGGWQLGLANAPGHAVPCVLLSLAGGLLGAALCLWLYFLGIFLLGASAGGILAAAVFGTADKPVQGFVIVLAAIVFGVIALVAQKLMIVACSACSGSYLAVTGMLHFVTRSPNPLPRWPSQVLLGAGNPRQLWPWVVWLILGLAGLGTQLRGNRVKVKEEKDA